MEIDWYVLGLQKHQSSEYYAIKNIIENQYYKYTLTTNNLFISIGKDGELSVNNMRHPGEKLKLDCDFMFYVELNESEPIKNDMVVISSTRVDIAKRLTYEVICGISEILTIQYAKYAHCIDNYNEIKTSPDDSDERDIVVAIDYGLSACFSCTICKGYEHGDVRKLAQELDLTDNHIEAFLKKRRKYTALWKLIQDISYRIHALGIEQIEDSKYYDKERLRAINAAFKPIKNMCDKVLNREKLTKVEYDNLIASAKGIKDTIDEKLNEEIMNEYLMYRKKH